MMSTKEHPGKDERQKRRHFAPFPCLELNQTQVRLRLPTVGAHHCASCPVFPKTWLIYLLEPRSRADGVLQPVSEVVCDYSSSNCP